jgi:hypothetical protein
VIQFIERYRWGIIAAFTVFTGVFIYLQFEIYEQYWPVDPFSDQPEVSIQDDKELIVTPEDLIIQQNQDMSNVKSIARSSNDQRKRSDENWTQNSPSEDGASKAKDYEKRLFEETGGAAKRQAIKEEMEQRKKDRSTTSSDRNSDQTSSQKGGNTAYSGNVMVDWSLKGRTPHQNDNWWIRNPGYTCGYGSAGRVTVHIKVNQNGDVISAVPTASAGSNQCMIDQAVRYARKSRFNYSGSSAAQQEGTITYTFVSQ